jgi:hypothetical protein
MMEAESALDRQQSESMFSNYLPDELLLQVLDWLPVTEENQGTLWNFVLVSRYVDIQLLVRGDIEGYWTMYYAMIQDAETHCTEM